MKMNVKRNQSTKENKLIGGPLFYFMGIDMNVRHQLKSYSPLSSRVLSSFNGITSTSMYEGNLTYETYI